MSVDDVVEEGWECGEKPRPHGYRTMQLEAILPPQTIQVSHVPTPEKWPSDDCPHPPIHNFFIHNSPILLSQSTLTEQLPHTNVSLSLSSRERERETLWKQLERGPALRKGRPVGDKHELCRVLSTRSYNMKKKTHKVVSLAVVM